MSTKKRFRYKAFAPKPGEPGSVIEWEHSHVTGDHTTRTTTRTGTVWSGAPTVGLRAVWVTPHEPLPTDRYALIYVRTAKNATVNTSDDNPNSIAGGHTMRAGQYAALVRSSRTAS